MQTEGTSPSAVVVRVVRAADAERLKALRLEAVTTSPTSFGADVEYTLGQDWNQLAAESDGVDDRDAIFVAEHAGALVGMTGVRRLRLPKQRHACSVWGVFVRPAFRGRGVARALLTAATEWAARQSGVTIVRLMVTTVNHQALACYRRCGYEVTGIEVATLHVDGREYDEFLMCKRLV